MQLTKSTCAILLLTLSRVAFAFAALEYAADVQHTKAPPRTTKRADVFAEDFLRRLPQEDQSLKKRQTTCPIGSSLCSDGVECCPTGSNCIPANLCNIPCTSDDVSCGDGTCCPPGSVCLEVTCVGINATLKPPGASFPDFPDPPDFPEYDDWYWMDLSNTGGAPFLTVDAMLGGVLGIAAGYLVM